MELLAFQADSQIFIVLPDYHSQIIKRSLHHTGLKLIPEELDKCSIARPLILTSLPEQPVK